MEAPTVLVIGAGIGGITVAAYLAREGFRVTVLEKNKQPGGRCGQFAMDGHRFDTGPTLFLIPELFTQAFTDLDECVEDHLDLKRIDPSYTIHFNDGTTLELTSDMDGMRAQLESIEVGSFDGYLRYLEEGRKHYAISVPGLVKRNFRSAFEFFSLRNLLLFLRLKPLKKHYDNVGTFISDHRLKIALTFQDMYVGLSPYEAPALFSLLQYAETVDGVWLPMGGMYRVTEALEGIAKKWGTQFIYNTPVERINLNGKYASGVTFADGRRMNADVIIANADLPYVYRHLLPDEAAANRIERKEFSCSTLMFHWGVDKQFPQLGTHNLFFGDDSKRSFDQIFDELDLPDSPSFYVHTPVRIDPSFAPDGQDSLTVIVPVGHKDCDESLQDWPGIQERARREILRRLGQIGIHDLEAHIKFEVTVNPCDWQDYLNLAKGATHGLSHKILQMGYLRPHNQHAHYRNLYFVGASTHPGTGLPTVLVSARHVADSIFQDVGFRRTAREKRQEAVMQGEPSLN
ncbi:MAG: phytoene desaturase [Anaerolineales bacterium]|nr:phytoene desaturase [Anaerolineales bacterium]